MKMTSKIKTTSEIMMGSGLSFQAMFAVHNTSKSCILHSSIAIWNYSGLGRVGSAWSNSDYKAISASQHSWSFGLAELGKNWVYLKILVEMKLSCYAKKFTFWNLGPNSLMDLWHFRCQKFIYQYKFWFKDIYMLSDPQLSLIVTAAWILKKGHFKMTLTLG